jgi:hypothetical protein
MDAHISPRQGISLLVEFLLIHHVAVNMSCMSTIQSTVAEDFDAFLYTNWFTSAFLVGLSSSDMGA